MTFVEVKFECINWWGNEVYRTKNGTPNYETYDIVSNNKATFKLVKTPNKHKSCNYCPLIKHFCGRIECYCIAKKVY